MTERELTKIWAKVTGKFNALIDGAPEALNTLKKITDKLGDNDDALAGLLTQVGGKQDALVSGQNIKTVNGNSLLGEGNLELGELFVVRMTRNNSNSVYTADKSVSEIYEASYTNGKPVIAIMRDISNPVFILTDCDPDADSYVFSSIESNTVTTLRWQRSDDYTYELETIVLQPHLVSGTNIKTINSTSLLGGGNVDIVGKSAYQSYVDTTTDSPVKTEAEWVASLKGEDGVSLGEVAIADNLTTDDATKVLSAKQGYLLGQKVNDVDDVPTAGSEKFVKSGGVQNELSLGAVYDVSAKNPTAGINNDGKWESLSTLLFDANLNTLIPTSVRKGGMSIKFVQSSDNKYVQYRLMATSWSTNVSDWQGVGTEPTAGSKDLVDGAGVAKFVGDFVPYIKTVKHYAFDHSGRALTANGLSIEDANYSLIDYAVNAGEFIYVSLSKDSDGVCQFQSASFVPSSRTNTNLIGRTITAECNGVVRVPEGATYLIVSQLSTNETNKVYSCSNSVDTTVTKNSKNLLTSGAAYDSIKDNLKDVLPLPEYPWIKEIYINEAGVTAGVSMLHSINPDTGRLNFANAQGSAYTGRLTFTESVGIFNIVDWNTQKTTLGYCLIDGVVGKQEVAATPLAVFDERQRSIDYSPSIKTKLLNEYVDVQDEVLDYDIDKVLSLMYENEEGDKDFSLLTSSVTNDSVVFIQYPKNNKQCTVNRITFKAKQGTTKFYLVTVGTPCTCSLITEVETVLADNGKIKHIDLNNPITLGPNQYIGISCGVFFGLDDNAQGFQGANVTISTGKISVKSTIALGYILENTENIFGRLEDLEEKFLDVNISSYGTTVGETINNPARIITLAADGTGTYSDFPSAVSACISAGDATLVIKQGVYNIPVRTTGDYAIAFDIVGIGNPILKCINDATGDDFLDIKQNFSPFRILSTHDAHKTIKVEGITLIAKDVRYCVHDELGALNHPSYTHIFKNCNFMHLSDPDQDWTSPRCIGGGLGNHGLILIENCEFKSGILTSVDYHEGYGGNQQSSKVIVKDCVLANNTVSCTTISASSEKSVMVVQNCILKALPICNDYQGRIDVELVEKDNILV